MQLTPLALVCLLVACAVMGARSATQQNDCSPELSREVRTILKDDVFPVVDYLNYVLPANCVFHPSNDAYRGLEKLKRLVRKRKWKCRECSRTFEEEKAIDEHLIWTHKAANITQDTICLADYCHMLGCPSQPLASSTVVCNEKLLQQKQFECKSVLSVCFPPSAGPAAIKLSDIFTRKFCNRLSCTPNASDPHLDEHLATWSKWFTVKLVLSGIALFFLALFYGGLVLYRQLNHRTNMTQKLKASRHSFFASLAGKKDKTKPY